MSPFSSSQRTRFPFHQRSRMSGLPSLLISRRTISSEGEVDLSAVLRSSGMLCCASATVAAAISARVVAKTRIGLGRINDLLSSVGLVQQAADWFQLVNTFRSRVEGL